MSMFIFGIIRTPKIFSQTEVTYASDVTTMIIIKKNLICPAILKINLQRID